MNEPTLTWRTLLRVAVKTAVLFALCNAVFAWTLPLEWMGTLSLYNRVYPGRSRLPYGKTPAEDFSVTVNNVPALMHSHRIGRAKAADEFRVVVLGDSGTWGWLLPADETLTAVLNRRDLRTADGRRMVFYNLAYPQLSLTKDVLLLEAAVDYEPDAIVWPITLESMPIPKQSEPPLVQHNRARLRPWLDDLSVSAEADFWVTPSGWERTIVGQRRPLANLLRLQLYGASWAATGIDQAIPPTYEPRRRDFDPDPGWHDFDTAVDRLPEEALAWGAIRTAHEMAGEVPLLLINQPIFVSDGENSDIRYNSFYPRWAYDQYRAHLAGRAAVYGWRVVDVWNAIPPQHFTDTPVHLSAEGVEQWADLLAPHLAALDES